MVPKIESSIGNVSLASESSPALPANTMLPVSEGDNTLVNILIVDDEPRNLDVLESVLVDPRYRLIRAESADEALLALVSEEFALIVLDIHMPGMNGFELAQMIKQRKKTANVPIIFLTAYYSEDQHVLEGYSTGAVDYLHKPINATVLRSKVAVFVDLYIKTRECAMTAKRLHFEVSERRIAQDQLLELNSELERRVDERTSRLMQTTAALQESEERLRLANEASGMGLWEWNLQTDHVRWSPECQVIHGLHEGEFDFTIGRFFELIHSDDRVRVQSTISAAIEEENAFSCDYRIVCPNGELRWVTSKGRMIFASEMRPKRMIGTIIDISHRKEAELKLLKADRHKDEFLATLSHELRNPLAPIRNAVQIMLLRAPRVPELQWASEMIDRQVRQMTRLVDDLLEVSRITTGKLEIRKQHLELATVMREAVETSLPLIEQDGHKLTVTMPPQPVIVHGDMIRLAQVFSNLLNNAAKYTEPGGHIELGLDVAHGYAVVTVKDSGVGIPSEMLPHIFDMFTQVDKHLHRSKGGLGIGLTLVKRLVEMHEGTIEGHSDGSGCGSQFTIRLPIIANAAVTVVDENSGKTAENTPLRILVVDDNKDSANSLARMLQIVGNETQVAHDGLAAVTTAETFAPDVVLLDIGMPVMNGYDACRKIREQAWSKGMVLIALTGWGQDDDRRRTREAGFDYHLVKPVEADVLMKLLERV